MWGLENASIKPILGTPGHVNKIVQVENSQKVDEFEPTNLGNHQYRGKMVCDF